MAHWGSTQGQAEMAKITQKHPYLCRSPRKPQTQNEKRFFRCQLEDLLNLWRV